MLGILVQLIISWIIIWFFEKNNLQVLGFYPSKKRLAGFGLFFTITALLCASEYLMRLLFADQHWVLNPAWSARLIFEGIWWNIKSVLFEELIFRGVLFYILIKKLGANKAIIISSIAFGIYHWFSYGIIGNPVQMLISFLATGSMGLIFAYAYSKTFSMLYPIAIHLGWNITGSVIFSNGNIGAQLLTPVPPAPQLQVSYFMYSCIVFVPMISAILINFFILKRIKQKSSPHPQSRRNQ